MGTMIDLNLKHNLFPPSFPHGAVGGQGYSALHVDYRCSKTLFSLPLLHQLLNLLKNCKIFHSSHIYSDTQLNSFVDHLELVPGVICSHKVLENTRILVQSENKPILLRFFCNSLRDRVNNLAIIYEDLFKRQMISRTS